jgi:hypothetical protein
VEKLFEAEDCCDRYIRIVPEIEGVTHKMDDASPKNIAKIKEAGEKYITTHTKRLDEIVKHLIN